MISFCKFCNRFTSGTFDAQHCRQCHVWFRPARTTFYLQIKDKMYEVDVDVGNEATTIKAVSGEEFDPSYDTRYITWFGKHIMTVSRVPIEISPKQIEEWTAKLLKLKVFL